MNASSDAKPTSSRCTGSWPTSTSFVTAGTTACPRGSGRWMRSRRSTVSSPIRGSRPSSPTGPSARCRSGRPDRDVVLAAEGAHVGRPVEDEGRRRVGHPEAEVERSVDRALVEVVAGGGTGGPPPTAPGPLVGGPGGYE